MLAIYSTFQCCVILGHPRDKGISKSKMDTRRARHNFNSAEKKSFLCIMWFCLQCWPVRVPHKSDNALVFVGPVTANVSVHVLLDSFKSK